MRNFVSRIITAIQRINGKLRNCKFVEIIHNENFITEYQRFIGRKPIFFIAFRRVRMEMEYAFSAPSVQHCSR